MMTASEIAEKHNAGLKKPGIGHNSKTDDAPAPRVAKDQLKAFIGRIETLELEKQSFADDIKDVYGEAKSSGFDVKALRRIVALRKMDAQKRKEQEAILETYMLALGMLD